MRSISALATLAMALGSASAAEPSPVSLAPTSHIVIVAKACGQQKATQERIADPTHVQALVAEFAAIRSAPEKIEAAKFACPVRVEFFAQEKKLTVIHVLPCSAFERAPVAGKRYFRFNGGLNKLPQLSRLSSAPARAACNDA